MYCGCFIVGVLREEASGAVGVEEGFMLPKRLVSMEWRA